MKRAEALSILAEYKGDDGISVATMRAIPDWYALGKAPERHLDNRGFMGGASSQALGLAIAQPHRRILLIDGDGSLLMQLGSLASIAEASPPNFYHVVLVNGVYETSGNQKTPAAGNLSYAGLARAAGYKDAFEFDDPAVLAERLPAVMASPGPVLVAIHVQAEEGRDALPGGRPADPAGYLRAQLVPGSDAASG
jgi:thiamine pyrophosphate-dependent acetolactate synthase large subunit-like protein